MPNNTNKVVIVVCLITLLLVGGIAMNSKSSSGPKPDGIYIVPDGVSCLRFTNDPTGLKVEAIGQYKQFENSDDLMIKEGMVYLPVGKGGLSAYFPPTYYAVMPSKNVPGDWNLVRPKFRLETEDGKTEADSDYLINFPEKNPDFLKEPILYLHRLDDEKIVRYFDIIKNENNIPLLEKDRLALLTLAEEIVRDHPDDPYAHIFHLDALIRSMDVEKLERKISEVKNDFLQSDDKYLGVIYYICRDSLEGIQAQNQGRNAYDFTKLIYGPETNLKARLSALPGINKFDTLKGYPEPITGSHIRTEYFSMGVTAKVILMRAYFDMIKGEGQNSLDLLFSSHKLGLLIADRSYIPLNHIGRAFQDIALKGFEIYFLNAARNAGELEEVWNYLEEANKANAMDIYQNCLKRDYHTPLKEAGYDEYEKLNLYIDHSIVGVKKDVARFQVLRAAVAARHCQLDKGRLPESEADFAPLLPNGLPDDPFNDGQLDFISKPDSITIYSLGPDSDDDHASIEYDPTNGSLSSGDVFLNVPKERQYPFPKDGLKAASVADVYSQFPNGLPVDIFADKRDSELGVSEDDDYIYIYSVGPDVNQQEIMYIPDYVPTIHYDPTNGTTSDGDLFIKLPKE